MPGLNLTKFEAEGRSRVISNPQYWIYLDLTENSDQFDSITTVEFNALFGTSTFIDLVAAEVYSITLNERSLDPQTFYQDYRIELEDLQEHNRLTVRAKMAYSNQGEGLHKFVDPEDGLTYLYSQFEVPDSRKVFAVFEQPDIKGTFGFRVVAPAGWEVISNQPTLPPQPAPWVAKTSSGDSGQGAQIFSFARTPKLSSYVTAICAGPYAVFADELTNTDGRTIPLRVMCRQSLAKYADVETILDITKKGFEFYGQSFDFPYPYAKYDQVFVPEFNAGAMENAGLITYRDEYIFRSRTPSFLYEGRCITILHELAHMWFGDLVTMKWWNDLWLNESFATFMSTLAAAEVTDYRDEWVNFNIVGKSAAFNQDDLPTTHPISASILDLQDVQVNFDRITYAKGASALKQFVAYVGRENFFNGIAQYLKKNSFSNATLSDLVNEIELASKRNLKSWCISWLETAGPNTLTPVLTIDDSLNVQKFQIRQSAPSDHPTIRPHRLGIGLYNFAPDPETGTTILQRDQYHEVDIDGTLTTLALKDFRQPDLLLLNDADLTYAKITLDPRSLKTALSSVELISDPLARSLVLNALYEMVLQGTLKTEPYLNLVARILPLESHTSILRQLLLNLNQCVNFYSPEEQQGRDRQNAGDAVWTAFKRTANSDLKLQLIQAFCGLASTPQHGHSAQRILASADALGDWGIELDWEMRWNLLSALINCGQAGVEEIAQLEVEDPSALGAVTATKLRAQIDTHENKAAAFDLLFRNIQSPNFAVGSLSNAKVRAITQGFQISGHSENFTDLVERYYADILTIWQQRDFQNAETLVVGMYPFLAVTEACAVAGEQWLAQNFSAPRALIRLVQENLYVTRRALRIRAANSLPKST